ncbi:formyl transferase [Novosphingobium sp. BL-8H]|uniref:glucosamine inositolphosphorylceramide transferase family protein n=1 Tax=Novosphingobium sp. BL-8H TaxID=3127640 RepID=UPI003756CBFD
MPRRKDIWHCGIVRRPIERVLAGDYGAQDVVWFPREPEFTFLADPFGHDDGTHLHVFAEQYDYRTRHGVIERLTFDRGHSLVDRRLVLKEPWHLSYPQVFRGEGEVWMLPEAHRSGGLTLYRGDATLDRWTPECRIELDSVPVDASILHHDGRWWLFYSSGENRATKLGSLRVAWAERLAGPWTALPGNPVRLDRQSARPGGTPVVIDGRIMLPTQDCSSTYGGAIRPLWITRLDTTGFTAEAGDPLALPPSAPRGCEGMHTLSACGDVTLFDVKTIDRSFSGLLLELRRMLGRYAQE